ncbi:MAG: hypothetical protein AAFY26_20710 [Cyanobacteria bacterium J06638_22]
MTTTTDNHSALAGGAGEDKPVLVNDFLNRSFQNRLAKEVTYTKPVILGVVVSFGAHSFLGPILMGINPLLGLASLLPVFVGIRAAKTSADGFFDTYEESIENPDLWTEFVNPDALAGTDKLLQKPVDEVIREGLATRRQPGKPLPLHQQIKNLMEGARASQNSPTSSQTEDTRASTASYTDTTRAEPFSDGTSPTDDGKSSTSLFEPSEVPTWPDETHLFMVGLSGGAKTTVLQQATANVDGPIIYLTIKTNDKAPPGWIALRLDKFAGTKMLRQLDWVVCEMKALVRKGVKHRLVIDEYPSIRDGARISAKVIDRRDEVLGELKTVPDLFEGLRDVYIRAGRSDGHYLGLLSQTPNGTDNFPSAKTQQGLKIVLCASQQSSEKFRFFAAWAKQLFGGFISEPALAAIKSIKTGYWHLFSNGQGLVLNQTQRPTTEMVPCKPCPTSGSILCVSTEAPESEPLQHPDVSEDDQPEKAVSEAEDWQIPQLIEELVSKELLPIRVVELGKTAWAGRLSRIGLIAQRNADAMSKVAEKLIDVYDKFYLDDEGLLCLLAPYGDEKS